MLNRFRAFTSCVPDIKELAGMCAAFVKEIYGRLAVIEERLGIEPPKDDEDEDG